MGDWSDVIPAPLGVSYFSSCCGIHSVGAATGFLGGMAGSAYPIANKALFIPFRVMAPTRITKLFVVNSAIVFGNIDLGIYNSDGTRVVSTGSTAHAGVDTMQIITLGIPIRLTPDFYYMAISMNNTTASLYRVAPLVAFLKVIGMAEQTTAFPLPATATFATISSLYLPVIGFISEEG